MPKLLSLAQVARELCISDTTAAKIARDLPGAVHIGARIKYRSDLIQKFIEAGGTATEPKPTAN